MVLEDFYMISQVVAAFAVMGSLIFVGLQMRQSNRMQQSIVHQARTDRNINQSNTMADGLRPVTYGEDTNWNNRFDRNFLEE